MIVFRKKLRTAMHPFSPREPFDYSTCWMRQRTQTGRDLLFLQGSYLHVWGWLSVCGLFESEPRVEFVFRWISLFLEHMTAYSEETAHVFWTSSKSLADEMERNGAVSSICHIQGKSRTFQTIKYLHYSAVTPASKKFWEKISLPNFA